MITRDELRQARRAHVEAQASHEAARIAFQQAAVEARSAQKNWERIRDAFVLQESSDENTHSASQSG